MPPKRRKQRKIDVAKVRDSGGGRPKLRRKRTRIGRVGKTSATHPVVRSLEPTITKLRAYGYGATLYSNKIILENPRGVKIELPFDNPELAAQRATDALNRAQKR